MKCERIIGTTHHGTYKKVIDVLFTRDELTVRNCRKIARDGIELEIELDDNLQERGISRSTYN